ncbi:hypothetical protein C8A03DRAFT_33375 [Achaetomium macrosporum]|uniref:Uncharacterized protein n=1 Tax=Achaetomium macrosporum TaxID=79813 RepID=A0AAN7H7F3_9PEZI|nr:hypothetical protein C8A03DRAFT_33375 [Achaetomium macrosporum]
MSFAPHPKLPERPHRTWEERLTDYLFAPPVYSNLSPPTDVAAPSFTSSSPPTHTEPALQLPPQLEAVIQHLRGQIARVIESQVRMLEHRGHVDGLFKRIRIYERLAKRTDQAQLVSEIQQARNQIHRVYECLATIQRQRGQANQISDCLANIERHAQDVSTAVQIVSAAIAQVSEIAQATNRNGERIFETGNAVLDSINQVSPPHTRIGAASKSYQMPVNHPGFNAMFVQNTRSRRN